MIANTQFRGSQDVAQHYDQLDVFYRDLWGEHVHHGFWEKGKESTEEAVLHLSHYMARLAKVQRMDRICDVGCGYGGTARILADTYGAQVRGYTLSKEQEAFARQHPAPHVDILCQNFLENREQPASMDIVLSIECIEHLPDKVAFFREAWRLLVPGGRLALAVWSESPKATAWDKEHLLLPICLEGRMPDLLTGDEWRALMENAGFQIKTQTEHGRQVKKTWAICAARLVRKVATESAYRKFLLHAPSSEKVFALTLLRLWLAFEKKAMDYWIFLAEKPLAN